MWFQAHFRHNEMPRKLVKYFVVNAYLVKKYNLEVNILKSWKCPCPAELFQLHFSSFEAGIASAIFSFK